jgi:hypothetical protein
MKKIILKITFAVVAILNIGCTNMKIQQINQEEAIHVAEEFVVKKYPDFNKANKKLIIIDRGESWLITYELPKGMLGGTPEIFVDKISNKVIKYYRWQ